MAKTQTNQVDSSTEEKIKQAARIVFTRKGYAATRTRDIAEEAGLNLALLNYYFRSKEKLFELIMMEKVQKLFGILAPLVNDPNTSLEEKVDRLTNNYFVMLTQNPDLPLFVLSEIRSHGSPFGEKVQVGKLLRESHLMKQVTERRPDLDPLQVAMTLLGMIVFPFIAKPILFNQELEQQEAFAMLIEDRKRLIPLWFQACIGVR
ncbi:MAG: TetR/AcrR family transcriptional regulator [Chitinophagaceae bacterium]|nr:TetR/AcrR family transcriptional regulator [Chitinophagaceae bacterium]